ncbi:endonuclease domain-containing protein [Phreatobacter oligotrophus]|uniref:Very-short-patch-repair endonuclease n=1 Tax=Phreatobacter oligotrophus TaxID=1122261 RepID=A0A2T4ZI15_9HYPH|nr:DUF559 domain-containing protein [Phreatobacter oligotrophus]PTM61613.1 very-short-patch-repair endonuclease [Phreatobacter oligotrophus]
MERRRDHRIPIARRLRREATFQERLIWNAIRQFAIPGFHPRRQAPVGPYIVDFACHSLKIVIEIDGDHHGYGEQAQRDAFRDDDLRSRGYEIIRVSNHHIAESLDGAVETILAACLMRGNTSAPIPSPPQEVRGQGSPTADDRLAAYEQNTATDIKRGN